ncbi:MAG: hypothetical protein K2K88_06020 [Muribaculaceae bacterium]|nr:hypothetical protein [Muribaculaceae bacterium]
MKILRYIPLFIAAVATLVSCEKNEIEFPMEHIDAKLSQIQLYYLVPQVANNANSIYKVEIDDQEIVQPNNAAVISVNNFIPSGAVAVYYATDPKITDHRIKMYKGTSRELVYDRTIKLLPGKQQVVVHDFDKDPVVIDAGYDEDGFSFATKPSFWSDSTGYVRLYNFLYEEKGVPYPGKIQYQGQFTKTWGDKSKTEWFNVGEPVAFGEATSWNAITVNAVPAASYGDTRVDYRIVDENGDVIQVLNASNKMVNYSDYWTLRPGRRYMHLYHIQI